jgi:ATP-dependent Clp protease ATP-binding subunit ClpA
VTVGGFSEWMGPDAGAVWMAANAASVELGHSWVGTEHLLLGLLAGPPSDPAVAALTAAGVTAAAVRAALVRDLAAGTPDDRSLLATLGVDLDAVRVRMAARFGPDAIGNLYARRRRARRRLARGPLCGSGVAPRAKRALERARRSAKAAHRARFDSSDLLLGLLEVDDGMAVRLLRHLGVDPDSVRARLPVRAA